MATALMLTPRDHGRPMSREEHDASRGTERCRYELIDGKIYVSPKPDLPEDRLIVWITYRLHDYLRTRSEIIRYISGHAAVVVPGRSGATVVEPDLAVYQDFPPWAALARTRWDDVSPALVVEVAWEDDPDKDLVRNVELYEQVPSIREYWILDPRPNPNTPSLRVYRRRGQSWQRPIDVPPGGTYTTRLLPGFTLRVDPMG